MDASQASVLQLGISSSAFENGTLIPSLYTCDGEDIIPPITVSGIPDGAKTLALVVDDPDSPTGTWDHWVIFNIRPDASFKEGKEPKGVRGKNSWGRLGYGGPCPGQGQHRYFFKVYALDTELDLEEGSTKKDLESALTGHILAQGELMGRYERERK